MQKVDAIWSASDEGLISPRIARALIDELAGGYREPDWARSPGVSLDPRHHSTYRAEGGHVVA